MSEVDKSNFFNCIDAIEYNVKKSSFVSVDCEFSGLRNNSSSQHSLFDTAPARYMSLKESTRDIIILQFGLSTFTFNRDLNQYDVDCYKFYIVPRAFGSDDGQFLCQASSLEFLCRHKFDINKVIYDGIPYLNHDKEAEYRKLLEDGDLYYHIYSHLESEEAEEIHSISESVLSWLISASVNDVQTYFPSFESDCFLYILTDEIKKKFPNTWVYIEGQMIKVKVVSQNERVELEENDKNCLDKLIDRYVGFSKLFQILYESKKPLIGHNLLMDLMIMYRQLYKPLPGSLGKFKKSIQELFPHIYDTKVISYELQRTVNPEFRTGGTSLSAMYNYLIGKGNYLSCYSPNINLQCGTFEQEQNQQIHDAGWDSYMTGVIFIKLSHIFASKNSFSETRPLTNIERFSAIKHLENKINLARAADSVIFLEGNEGVSYQRPPVLYVCSRNRKKLDIHDLSGRLTKYGNFDVKRLDSHSALLAVMNFTSAKDILRDFYRNREWKVVRYNFFRHSPTFRKFLWAGLVIPVGITACYYAFVMRKKS